MTRTVVVNPNDVTECREGINTSKCSELIVPVIDPEIPGANGIYSHFVTGVGCDVLWWEFSFTTTWKLVFLTILT